MHPSPKPRALPGIDPSVVPLFPILAPGSGGGFAGCAADATVTALVKTALLYCPTLRSTQIHVETAQGRVRLSGYVASRHGKARAGVLARKVHGVRRVENAILVR